MEKDPSMVDETLVVVNAPSGYVKNDGISGQIISPSGDWARMEGNKYFTVNVRATCEMDDDSFLFARYSDRGHMHVGWWVMMVLLTI